MPQLLYPLFGNTNVALLDFTTKTPWVKNGGDWYDADGVLNGPKPTRTASGAVATVDVTGLGDVLIQGVNAVSKVEIDGVDVTAQCFWTDPTSNGSLAMPSHYGNPVIVPYGGKSMTVTSNATGAWRVDPVACQIVPDKLPIDASYYRAPDLFRVDPTSEAAVRAPVGTIPGPNNVIYTGPTQFLSEQGVPFARITTQGPTYPGTGNGRVVRVDYTVKPQFRMHVAYLYRPSVNVWDAGADLGTKLSGLGGDEDRFFVGEQSSARSIGGTPNPRDVQVFGIWSYFADQKPGSGPGLGEDDPISFARFLSQQFVFVEHGAQCNTFDATGKPNNDGYARTWINGVLVEDLPRAWFANAASRWVKAQTQIYQGGIQDWRHSVTFDMGPIMASTDHIGVPPDIANLLLNQSGVVVAPPPVVTPPRVVDPPPVVTPPPTDTPPTNTDDDMATQQQVQDIKTAVQAALDKIDSVMATPDDRDAQIATLQQTNTALMQQLAQAQADTKTAQDALAAEQAKLHQLNTDIDAAQAKDA